MALRGVSYLILLVNLLISTACVTSDDIGDRLQAWVGRDADQLAETWGAPIGTYVKNDGGKILTYSNSRMIVIPSQTSPRVLSNTCRIVVRIGPSGLVEGFNWQGNVSECDSLSLGPPREEPVQTESDEKSTPEMMPLQTNPPATSGPVEDSETNETD